MNVVLRVKTADGGSKEHGLIIRMCKNKKNVMLLIDGHSLFVDENSNESEKVESQKDIFKGGVDQLCQ